MSVKKKVLKKNNKKTVNQKKEKTSFFEKIDLKQETINFISGLIFVLLFVFFMASAFSQAGVFGDFIYKYLNILFGLAYFLIPLLLLVISVSFFKNMEKSFSKIKIVGSIFFLIFGIGFIDLLFEKGGIVGFFISKIENYLGFGMSVFLTLIFSLISLIIVFDGVPKFKKKEKQEKEENFELNEKEEKEIQKIEEEISKDFEEKKVKQEQEEKIKKPLSLNILSKKNTEEEKTEESLTSKLKSKILNQDKTGILPPLKILSTDKGKPEVGDIKEKANIIKKTLANFGIEVEMDEISVGPTVTRYALKPAEGVKLTKIASLQDDLALALAAKTLRMETPIPGKALVGIEIPNTSKTMVGLRPLFEASSYIGSKFPLPLALGKSISGDPTFINLAKAPHMLIAGATGAGKSVTVHAIINSLLYKLNPEDLKFIMVDPKRVELTLYNGIPHLLTPVITDPKKAILALKWAVKEMYRRYDILEENKVRDITSYKEKIKNSDQNTQKTENPEEKEDEKMPYIVIIIDELADIMQTYPKELESGIVSLAQMSRAVGIHLILSTQRPSVNVITGLIKANIPTRIALQVSSAIDSRTILDMGGAEKLLGQGDMLYMTSDMSKPLRAQSAFISEEEVKEVVKFLKKAYKSSLPDEIDLDSGVAENVLFSSVIEEDENEDELFTDAKREVISAGKASTSYLQRRLKIGYSRAARLIDLLEEKGIVGPQEGSKPREIILQNIENPESSENPENFQGAENEDLEPEEKENSNEENEENSEENRQF